jgi:hypothetical protein
MMQGELRAITSGVVQQAFENGIGNGGRFTVHLPRTLDVLEGSSTRLPADLEACTVLVVEDQRDAREMLCLLL